MSALSGKDILLAHVLGGKREVNPGTACGGVFNAQSTAKVSATLLHDGQAVVVEFFGVVGHAASIVFNVQVDGFVAVLVEVDRKSTRLNSSHVAISYAVFCL